MTPFVPCSEGDGFGDAFIITFAFALVTAFWAFVFPLVFAVVTGLAWVVGEVFAVATGLASVTGLGLVTGVVWVFGKGFTMVAGLVSGTGLGLVWVLGKVFAMVAGLVGIFGRALAMVPGLMSVAGFGLVAGLVWVLGKAFVVVTGLAWVLVKAFTTVIGFVWVSGKAFASVTGLASAIGLASVTGSAMVTGLMSGLEQVLAVVICFVLVLELARRLASARSAAPTPNSYLTPVTPSTCPVSPLRRWLFWVADSFTLQNCKIRLTAPNPGTGQFFDYCSRTCATHAALCEVNSNSCSA